MKRITLATLLALSACATHPDAPIKPQAAQASAPASPSQEKTAYWTYCDAVTIEGSLREEFFSKVHHENECAKATNEYKEHAVMYQMSAEADIGKEGVILDLFLNVMIYDRFVPIAEMQPAHPNGLDNHTVFRVFEGGEKEFSSGDIHVQMLTRQPDVLKFEHLCIVAFTTPGVKRPLDITFCRTYLGPLSDNQMRAIFRRVAQNDLPKITLAQ